LPIVSFDQFNRSINFCLFQANTPKGILHPFSNFELFSTGYGLVGADPPAGVGFFQMPSTQREAREDAHAVVALEWREIHVLVNQMRPRSLYLLAWGVDGYSNLERRHASS
jgi:hypothetical protein